MDGLDRFMGCMFGGAVGDALGFVIEFDDLKTIHKKYGPYGLRTVLKSAKNGNKSLISDDTQLALFTADGMLWADHDGLEPSDGLYRAYMRWYYTQTERIIHPEQEKWMKRQPHEVDFDYDIMGRGPLCPPLSGQDLPDVAGVGEKIDPSGTAEPQLWQQYGHAGCAYRPVLCRRPGKSLCRRLPGCQPDLR